MTSIRKTEIKFSYSQANLLKIEATQRVFAGRLKGSVKEES